MQLLHDADASRAEHGGKAQQKPAEVGLAVLALFAHGQRQRHKHQGAACKLEGAYAFIEEQRAGEGGNHHGGGDYKVV